jgi:cobalamin synthase
MRNNYNWTFLLLVVAQLLLCNYFHFTPYVFLTLLPALILCLPTRIGTIGALFIAFGLGLTIDFFAEGLLGLNALALVPVAFVRKPLIELIFGKEPFEHQENLSVQKYGSLRISLALIITLALFLVIYILADGAGTRPFWFSAIKLVASLFASWLLSLVAVHLLSDDER